MPKKRQPMPSQETVSVPPTRKNVHSHTLNNQAGLQPPGKSPSTSNSDPLPAPTPKAPSEKSYTPFLQSALEGSGGQDDDWFKLTRQMSDDSLYKEITERRAQCQIKSRERINRLSPHSKRMFLSVTDNYEVSDPIYEAAEQTWGQTMAVHLDSVSDKEEVKTPITKHTMSVEELKRRSFLVIHWNADGHAEHSIKVVSTSVLVSVGPKFRPVVTVAQARKKQSERNTEVHLQRKDSQTNLAAPSPMSNMVLFSLFAKNNLSNFVTNDGVAARWKSVPAMTAARPAKSTPTPAAKPSCPPDAGRLAVHTTLPKNSLEDVPGFAPNESPIYKAVPSTICPSNKYHNPNPHSKSKEAKTHWKQTHK